MGLDSETKGAIKHIVQKRNEEIKNFQQTILVEDKKKLLKKQMEAHIKEAEGEIATAVVEHLINTSEINQFSRPINYKNIMDVCDAELRPYKGGIILTFRVYDPDVFGRDFDKFIKSIQPKAIHRVRAHHAGEFIGNPLVPLGSPVRNAQGAVVAYENREFIDTIKIDAPNLKTVIEILNTGLGDEQLAPSRYNSLSAEIKAAHPPVDVAQARL